MIARNPVRFPMKPSETLLKNTNGLQEWLGTKSLLSAQDVEKRLRFATEHVLLPAEYSHAVIFSDETKIMLYYHNVPLRVWRKPLTALENKMRIPTVKFAILSVMVCDCIFSKGVGVIWILNEITT